MIVPEENIKYVFNVQLMKPGDILLMNTYESQRRLMPGCKYDHVAIYLGDAFLVEADGMGVVMNHVYSYAFREVEDGCVLRLKNGSVRMIEELLFWVRGRMAMEFGTQQARLVYKLKETEEQEHSNRTFCSRLVAQAYHQRGVDVVQNPDYCSPDDFLSSEYLEKVEPSLRSFTKEMSVTVMNAQKERACSDWNASLAELFQEFRHFYGDDIQTIDQFLMSAIHHTNMDSEAVLLLKKQRYMIPPTELTKNIWPWFSDDETFFNHFPITRDALFFLCNQFLHFDKTYLPIFMENAMNVSVISKINKDSQVVKVMARHLNKVYDEAVAIRKRLEYLYIETYKRDENGFVDFCKKYGFYKHFEYTESVLEISRLLRAMVEYGPADIGDYLKD